MKFPKISGTVWAWCFYDWANSAFILCVTTTFFPQFFKHYWASGMESAISTARLGFANAVAGLCVALLSPILGACGAIGNIRRKLFTFFLLLGVCACFCLYFIPQGAWFTALILFVAAQTGYLLANLFYDSLLPDITDSSNRDFVSSLGYAIGYFGSSLLFIVFLILLTNPGLVGLDSTAQIVSVSFTVVSLWWLLFSLPVLFWVKPAGISIPSAGTMHSVVKTSVTRLIHTAKEIRLNASIMLFLLAYWLYADGSYTIIVMANDFLLSIGLPLNTAMIAILLVQIVGFPSSIFFGFLSQRIGAQKTILIAIAGYIVISSGGAWFVHNQMQCYLFACMIGLFQGALQALSRSLYASMIPVNKETEYFGFYNMVGRFAAILGPAVVALSNLIGYKLGFSAALTSRLGISSVTIFFILGGYFLLKVREKPAAVILKSS